MKQRKKETKSRKKRIAYENKFLNYNINDFEKELNKKIPIKLDENKNVIQKIQKQAQQNILRNDSDILKVETLLAETCEYYNDLVIKARESSKDAILTAKYLCLSYIKWIKLKLLDTTALLGR